MKKVKIPEGINLLACPFCGSENVAIGHSEVMCACGAYGPPANKDDDQAKANAWNRRASK